jgi:hypothetical protein
MVKLLGFASLLSSLVGTAFVWFETKRLAYMLPSSEHLVLTKNAKFDAWYYGRAGFGFVLLLIGILLQGVYLFAVSECP